jgi:hypothetical protein
MVRPAAPLATQWDDAEKNFCNTSTINTKTQCNDDLCLCTHMLDIPKGEVCSVHNVKCKCRIVLHLLKYEYYRDKSETCIWRKGILLGQDLTICSSTEYDAF